MRNYDFEWRILDLLNKSEHVADTIRIVLEEFSKHAGAVAASVWLLDEEENIRLYAACGEKCGGLGDIVLRKGQGICGTCVLKNEVILSEDVTKSKEWTNVADKKTGFVTKSILSVPISGMNTGAFGCLQILNKKEGTFDQKDKELAQIIAGLMAEWFLKNEIDIPSVKGKEVLMQGKNLRKKYGTDDAGVWALNDVDFQINKGELTVILGSSGCGKSTLLNVIGGMALPDEGELQVDEYGDITKFDKKKQTEYRKNMVGFVFQFYNLIPELTAYENVALAHDMAKDPKDVDEVVKMMGLWEHRNHYPSQMSGGQQQRVSIARALVKNAKLLLCDEPTGALDFQTGRQILIELEKLVREQGQTVVIVTHTISIATIADRIIKMRSGKIIEDIINPSPAAAKDIEW